MEEHSKEIFNGHSRGSLKEYYMLSSKRKGSSTRSRSTQSSDLIEKIMSQCIVSGVILIIVLLICLVDTRFTIGARESVKSALSGDIGIELIIDKIKNLTQTYAGVKNSFNTIFGGVSTDGEPDELLAQEGDVIATDLFQTEKTTTIKPTEPVREASAQETEISAQPTVSASLEPTNEPDATPNNTVAPATPTTGSPAASNNQDDNFRIDEDILEEINSRVDFYYTRALIP